MKEFNRAEIEGIVGHTFLRPDLLLQAFTRRSFAEECQNVICEDNEVLEFIGDTVLSSVIVKKLVARYGRSLPSPESEQKAKEIARARGQEFHVWFTTGTVNERKLSEKKIALVSGKTLAEAIDRLGLQEYLRMGKGDLARHVEQEPSVKEDLLEAILGAIALDCGWDDAVLTAAVDRLLEPDRLLEEGLPGEPDYVELFRQWWRKKCDEDPEYRIVFREGDPLPYHCSMEFAPTVNGFDFIFSGWGKTEQGAIRDYARNVWETLVEAKENRARYLATLGEEIDYSRSVNILQELWQKGLIPKPLYKFSESSRFRSETGNPYWSCSCYCEDFTRGSSGFCETKAQAKQEAAVEALENLIEASHPLMPR